MILLSEAEVCYTPEYVAQLSYPDFVAFLRQKNTPPGGEATIRSWIEKAGITAQSHVMDLACTTGFSSRTAAALTGCSGVGIDISKAAVASAQSELSRAERELNLDYLVADARALPFAAEMFSHILGGCNFSFIQARERALEECHRVLQWGGKLCIANFYYVKPPTETILWEVNRVIGFQPKVEWTAAFWKKFFSARFQLFYEIHHVLPVMTEEVLERTIHKYLFEDSAALFDYVPTIREACYRRLLDTRLVLNRHRECQKFSIQLWRKA